MTVFKCYMKILRQNIGLVIMYLAIFFSVAIVLQFAAGKSEDSLFETASIDLGVVNVLRKIGIHLGTFTEGVLQNIIADVINGRM